MMIAAVRHSARTTTNTVEDSESTTGRGRSEPGHPDLQWGGWGVALAVTHQLRMLLGEGGGNASCVPRSTVKIAKVLKSQDLQPERSQAQPEHSQSTARAQPRVVKRFLVRIIKKG